MNPDNVAVNQDQFSANNNTWQSNLQGILQPRIIVAILAIIGSMVFGSGLLLWAMKDYVPVFPGLSQPDTARVTDYLNSRNLPYKVDSKSGLVLVPSGKARELQIELAGIGLLSSGTSTPDIFSQNQPLGTSQFIELARYQHTLESELSRTVANLRNIDSARIHLALPKRSTFVRKQGNASASVTVKMMAGRALEREQVRAIKSLVSSSVPYLETSRVTIVDEWGALLSGGVDDDLSEVSDRQFVYSRKLEEHYVQRIKELLIPLVGPDRLRVSVAADVDFTYEEETQETFEPDSAQVRSEQDQRRRTAGAGDATGIPGAVTNQPPEPAAGADGEDGEEPNPANDITRNLTKNYELDKKISHIRNAPGRVLRLSAAVVLDTSTGAPDAEPVDGAEPAAAVPDEADIELFTALVREAIGFDEERGDSVIVFNKSFLPPAVIEPPAEATLWEKPMIWTLARQGVAALIILVVALFIIRPALVALRREKVKPDGRSGAGDGEDGDADPDAKDASDKGGNGVKEAHGDILLMARTMARDDPKRVARVVKDWVETGEKSA